MWVPPAGSSSPSRLLHQTSKGERVCERTGGDLLCVSQGITCTFVTLKQATGFGHTHTEGSRAYIQSWRCGGKLRVGLRGQSGVSFCCDSARRCQEDNTSRERPWKNPCPQSGLYPTPRLLSFLDESTFVIFLHFPASPSDPLWAPLLCYPSRLGSSGGSAVVPLSLSTILIPPPLRIPCLSLISSPVFPTA